MSSRAEFRITGLSHDGRGIAARQPGELVTFVSGALPGEVVLAEIRADKKGFREAETIQLLQRSGTAIEPICPHAGECGGCPLMRMPYAEQCQWKTQLLKDALTRIGHFKEMPLNAIIPSALTEGFRNKIELAFGPGTDGRLHLGMRRRSSHGIVSTPDCRCLPEFARKVIPAIEEIVRELGLSAFESDQDDATRTGFRGRRTRGGWQQQAHGFLRFCQLRTGFVPDASVAYSAQDNAGKPAVWILFLTSPGSAQENSLLVQCAERILSACPEVHAVVHSQRRPDDLRRRGERRLFALSRQGRLPDSALILQPLAKHSYLLDIEDFFQVNPQAAEKLAEEAAVCLHPGSILDLYCGVGAPGLSCIRQGAITGIEYSEKSVRFASANAERFGIQATYFAGDTAKILQGRLRGKTFSQVLCDPPRNGLAPEVCTFLKELAPERIIYISCNPSTLARDARLLCSADNGYSLTRITPLDMFPHTPHVETVALLSKNISSVQTS